MRRTRQYGEHNAPHQDPLSAEERALQVMRIENASTALIDFGVKAVYWFVPPLLQGNI